MTIAKKMTEVLAHSSSCRPRGKSSKPDRLFELVAAIKEMTESEFTGHLKINFSQGGLGRIEKYEEILRNSQGKE